MTVGRSVERCLRIFLLVTKRVRRLQQGKVSLCLLSLAMSLALNSKAEFCGRTRSMTAKIANEQQNDLAANPHQAVPVVDDQSNRVYYLVDETFLLEQGSMTKLLGNACEHGSKKGSTAFTFRV